MQIVRIILAAVLAVAALVAGLFTAAVVAVAAMVAYIVLLIRNKSRAAPHTRPHAATRTHERRAAQSKGDFIDVEASEVPAVETDSLPRQH
jgi:type III secretory pathway component EscV